MTSAYNDAKDFLKALEVKLKSFLPKPTLLKSTENYSFTIKPTLDKLHSLSQGRKPSLLLFQYPSYSMLNEAMPGSTSASTDSVTGILSFDLDCLLVQVYFKVLKITIATNATLNTKVSSNNSFPFLITLSPKNDDVIVYLHRFEDVTLFVEEHYSSVGGDLINGMEERCKVYVDLIKKDLFYGIKYWMFNDYFNFRYLTTKYYKQNSVEMRRKFFDEFRTEEKDKKVVWERCEDCFVCLERLLMVENSGKEYFLSNQLSLLDLYVFSCFDIILVLFNQSNNLQHQVLDLCLKTSLEKHAPLIEWHRQFKLRYDL